MVTRGTLNDQLDYLQHNLLKHIVYSIFLIPEYKYLHELSNTHWLLHRNQA